MVHMVVCVLCWVGGEQLGLGWTRLLLRTPAEITLSLPIACSPVGNTCAQGSTTPTACNAGEQEACLWGCRGMREGTSRQLLDGWPQ